MTDLNVISIIGRLTRDPEIMHTKNANMVVNFTIANNRLEKVNYFDVSAWNKVGEFAGKYFQKGNRVVVTGYLSRDQWTDKHGNNQRKISIVATSVQSLEKINTGGINE